MLAQVCQEEEEACREREGNVIMERRRLPFGCTIPSRLERRLFSTHVIVRFELNMPSPRRDSALAGGPLYVFTQGKINEDIMLTNIPIRLR